MNLYQIGIAETDSTGVPTGKNYIYHVVAKNKRSAIKTIKDNYSYPFDITSYIKIVDGVLIEKAL